MTDVPGSDVPALPLAGASPEVADPPSDGGLSIAEAAAISALRRTPCASGSTATGSAPAAAPPAAVAATSPPTCSACGGSATSSPVAMEHVLSHVVHAAFAAASGRVAPTAAATPRPTVLACAPDEEHELPMVALAAALAERGIGSTLLGARTPPAAATSLRGGLLMVFALLPQDVPECVQDPAPGTTIVAAGPGWDPAALPPRVRHVNSLPAAIALFD